MLQLLKIEAFFCKKRKLLLFITHKAEKSPFLPPLYIIRGKKTLFKVLFDFIITAEINWL